jgi:CRISPR-associated protein Cas2
MPTPEWYLIAYDIADPRRLQRLHRAVRTEAIAIQRSVFLMAGSVAAIERLLDRLAVLIAPDEDDLRAYPIDAPHTLQRSGPTLLHGPLLHDSPTGPAIVGASEHSWRQRLARIPQPHPSLGSFL